MNKEKEINNKLITRSVAQVRASEDKDYNIEGYPIVFEQETNIGGWFLETIARDAIDPEVLKDVALFVNHDINKVPLARTRSKTLKLDIEEKGVKMQANIDIENRADAKELYSAISRGDLDGMSFMFYVEAEEWSDLDKELPKRRITKIGYVQEVSAVTYPAYEGTSIYSRTDLSLDSDKKALDRAKADALERAKRANIAKLKIEILNRRVN